MKGQVFQATFLVILMLLSGCLSSDSVTEEVNNDDENEEITASFTLNQYPNIADVGDIVIISGDIDISPADLEVMVTYDILTPSGIRNIDNSMILDKGNLQIILSPDEPGEWLVIAKAFVESFDDPLISESLFMVKIPEEGDAVITTQPIIELNEIKDVTIIGSVAHSNIESCNLVVDSTTYAIEKNGEFIISLGLVDQNQEITISTTCGIWTKSYDSKLVQIIVSNQIDTDGDGIQNDADRCPDGMGEEEGWTSTVDTDYDRDGCEDLTEDIDDDGDFLPDFDDDCLSELGWISNETTDHDRDGCSDNLQDDDDDNDGILDVNDECPRGELNWESKSYSDYDNDGCRDLTEDFDDDNDNVLDINDDCWRGYVNWDSIPEYDYDGDGCYDSTEDADDDSDGVNDVNETGVALDLCPRTPLNATDVDENGCDATERDSDDDGVSDFNDQCPGTPANNQVNSLGCADLDGDGVFSNIDNCSNTEEKWTVDSEGCAVNQLPVAWKENGHGNARMDTVANFAVPTLDGTWSFKNEWNGNDVYIFLFKYTDSSGNGNNGDWSKNPGSMIRQLPDNAHLFYGSFDNSYRNDVTARKNAVLASLNPDEEIKWQDRIHYIDQDMSTATGGLGDLINGWNTLYYGIDRFQRAREIGSIYAWTSSTNDITHWAYEARMYNYEYDVEIRETDPNIDVVTIVDEEWHSGGWSAGYTSTYSNVSISLPNNITSYDTLEVFHEHACEDRRNRYQKADSSYGGCHEWDYLAYMKICNRDNASKCGTEFMRWITTYGREGRWLTDITPYLFMLEQDDIRTFKYQGANKGQMTVKLLFSNWGEGERSFTGQQVFTGGEFNGQYNNETQYKRQHNFTTEEDYYRVKIVATITGHGFNQDQANCAEFCDHEHHYYLNNYHTYEWHPIVKDNQGCEKEVDRGVVANQFGSWPFGRAGWCAGQDVKQWTYDITDWVDNSTENNLQYRGLFNGQEYVPQDTNGGSRQIRANIWLVWYVQN